MYGAVDLGSPSDAGDLSFLQQTWFVTAGALAVACCGEGHSALPIPALSFCCVTLAGCRSATVGNKDLGRSGGEFFPFFVRNIPLNLRVLRLRVVPANMVDDVLDAFKPAAGSVSCHRQLKGLHLLNPFLLSIDTAQAKRFVEVFDGLLCLSRLTAHGPGATVLAAAVSSSLRRLHMSDATDEVVDLTGARRLMHLRLNKCGKAQAVKLPPGVRVTDGAFSHCMKLTRLDLSQAVMHSTGLHFASQCRSLVLVALPSALVHIGGDNFAHCCSLATLDLSANIALMSVGPNFAVGCTALAAVVFPAAFMERGTLGESPFRNCPAPLSVQLPSSFSQEQRIRTFDTES